MSDRANSLSGSTLAGVVFGALFRAATLLVCYAIAVVGGTLTRDALSGDLVICNGGSLVAAAAVMAAIALPAGIAYIFVDVAVTITLLRRQTVARRRAMFFALVALTIVSTGAYYFAKRVPMPPRPCAAPISSAQGT